MPYTSACHKGSKALRGTNAFCHKDSKTRKIFFWLKPSGFVVGYHHPYTLYLSPPGRHFNPRLKKCKISFEKPISCIYICNRRVANGWHNRFNLKMKVEVFKTNVADPERAKWLVDQIEGQFINCKVNFDLDDCDRVLRVVSEGNIQSDLLIDLLRNVGYNAEVLPDTIHTI